MPTIPRALPWADSCWPFRPSLCISKLPTYFLNVTKNSFKQYNFFVNPSQKSEILSTFVGDSH